MQTLVRPARCLVVASAATGLLAAIAALVLPDLAASLDALRAPRAGVVPFDVLLVRGCAVIALLAATWLWGVTCVVSLLAARGRSDVAPRGVPAGVRRVVLLACGVALAGAVAAPADASPGLGGLPLPDRATGAAHAPVVVRAAPARVAGPRGGPAPPARGVVEVRAGDTLWDLAARHLPPGADDATVTACWHRIHELNRDLIGDDPDLIRPGQRLRLPQP